MINKKGFISSGPATVFLYFGFILLVIIFYFVLRLTIGETKVPISGKIEDVGANYEVLNYLRIPVKFTIDDKDINTDMGDLLVRYFLAQGTKDEGKFQVFIIKKTEEIFNEKYPNLKWKLKVSDKTNDFAKTVASGETTSKLTKEDTLVKEFSIVCILIPNPESKNPIKVEFNFLNLNVNAFVRSKFYSLKNMEFNC